MDGTPTRIVQLVPSWEHVGALRRIGMLAAHLDRNEHEFHIVALSARGPDPTRFVGNTLKTIALAAGRRLAIPSAWRLRRHLRDGSADVVHAWSSSSCRAARFASWGLHGVRIVEIRPEDISLGIDAVQLRREVESRPSRNQLLVQLGLPPQAKLLGTAGRLTREKQVTELLWALDQIRCVRDDVYLLVIGDGDSRPLYERYSRLYAIADRVRFLGWRNDAAALIAQLDVYCSASNAASPSLAVLEAMTLGVPVVAGDTAAHRQLVAHGETGFLVDVRQRSEMARWCLRVLEDGALAARMRAGAQRRADEEFPIEPLIARMLQLYADHDD